MLINPSVTGTEERIYSVKYIVLTSLIMFILDKLYVLSSSNHNLDNKFLVKTEGCIIPAFPLFDDNMKKLVDVVMTSNCTENIHLLDYNSTHIWVVEDSLDFYNVMTANDFYCCYRYFYADKNIANIVYGSCVEFTLVIKAEHEFTRVECYYLDSKIYNNFFLFPKFIASEVLNVTSSAFNILLFGFESVSRMNFLRSMPMTSKFFHDKGSIQLLGYNKVGDNSFPNLFPMLLGKSFKQVKKQCIRNYVIDTSECILLWTKLKDAGYDTALASDSTAGLLGTYEYNFPKIPVDYYLQPFMSETKSIFRNERYNYHQCLQNEYYYKIFLKWSAHLLKKTKKNLFGIFWEESISHEHLNLPQGMDIDYYRFFKKLEDTDYLNDTIVILFSDHGRRWGEIAQTPQGRAENRLPLFEILLPKRFEKKHLLAVKNFKRNVRRLTSPYDVHETLLDLVHNRLEDDEIIKRSKYITRDTKQLSLFLTIPKERKCTYIGISEQWCTCEREKITVINEQLKLYVATYMINQINNLIRKYKKCHQLKIEKILSLTVTREKKSKTRTYTIMLQTSPGNGIFEGTLRGRHEALSIADSITRLNLYRNTSQCVQDEVIKKYCICR